MLTAKIKDIICYIGAAALRKQPRIEWKALYDFLMHLEKLKMPTAMFISNISSNSECLLTGQEVAECKPPYMRFGILLKAHTAIKFKFWIVAGSKDYQHLSMLESALLYGGLLCGRVRASLGVGSNPTALHKFKGKYSILLRHRATTL